MNQVRKDCEEPAGIFFATRAGCSGGASASLERDAGHGVIDAA